MFSLVCQKHYVSHFPSCRLFLSFCSISYSLFVWGLTLIKVLLCCSGSDEFAVITDRTKQFPNFLRSYRYGPVNNFVRLLRVCLNTLIRNYMTYMYIPDPFLKESTLLRGKLQPGALNLSNTCWSLSSYILENMIMSSRKIKQMLRFNSPRQSSISLRYVAGL